MDVSTQYLAAREAAALFDLSQHGTIIVGGDDRRSFLDSVISAEISKMPSGGGAYSALLEPKGKYIADLRVFDLPEHILIDCHPERVSVVLDILRKYRFRAKITLSDATEQYHLVSLQGPAADSVAFGAGIEAPGPERFSTRWLDERFEGSAASRFSQTGGSGIWIWLPRSQSQALMSDLLTGPAILASPGVQDVLRVEAGEPEWGKDIDATVIPIEAGQDRALSFSKCYPGQEVVSRIHFRGHVNRYLQIIDLDCIEPPPTGSPVRSGGRHLGYLTTVVQSPLDGRVRALGYVRREALLSELPLTVESGGESCRAYARPLPYRPVD